MPPSFRFATVALAAAAAVLSQIHSYLYIDEVLSIGGATAQSVGTTSHHAQSGAMLQYFAEFDEGKLFRHVPLRAQTPMNNIADTLLQVREALGGKLLAYQLDWVKYFAACHKDLLTYQHGGSDMRKALEEFWEALAKQPAEVRDGVRSAIAAFRPAGVQAALIIDCEQAGLRDIVDCARFVETIPMSAKGRIKKAMLNLCGQQLGLRLVRALSGMSRGLRGQR